MRIQRRVQTVKMFLRFVKANLRPPALILLTRAPQEFFFIVFFEGLIRF
jgi:hypothetical protein